MTSMNKKPLGSWNCIAKDSRPPTSRGSLWTNNPKCVDLTDRIFALIDSAKTSLWVASPIIDDPRIVDALKKAKYRRVRVKVITDIRNNRGRGSLYLTRGFEAKSEEDTKLEAHQACIRELARERVPCRSPTHYPHFKLILADNLNGLLSSANLTENSLGGTDKSSLEAGLEFDDLDRIEQLSFILSSLWNSCPFRLILSDSDVSIEERGSGECVTADAKEAEAIGLLVNSPGEHFFSLTASIVEGINGSERELTLATMSFFETNRVPRLEEALLAALDRGVNVMTVIRPEHFREAERRGQFPDASTKRLIESGMKLRGISGLHAKGLLVDRKEAIIFSANINPFSLTSERESNHMELGLKLLPSDRSFECFCDFMSELSQSANQQFALNPEAGGDES